MTTSSEAISRSREALIQLKEGNKRFVRNEFIYKDMSALRREELATQGQKPFAIILCCSDSRVPPEIIFDQGMGALFVVRNAGNVVDASTLGSIEYGVEHLKIPLIVVLGHNKCGAVKAAADGEDAGGSIGDIVEKIKSSLIKIVDRDIDKNELYSKCEDENIINSIEAINNSEIIKAFEENEGLEIIGAKYIIEDGVVYFN